MRKLLIILNLILVFTNTGIARDFTYKDVIYTVLDENTKTVETKAGYQLEIGEDTYYIPGNHPTTALLWLTSTVYDGDTEYTLTRIGDFSFCENKAITLAVIPESVEEIGNYAFLMCNNLYGLNTPEEYTIGEYSFYGCTRLSVITLPKNLEKINTGAFALCLNLKDIEIPSSVTEIGFAAFMGTGIEQLTLPNNVATIGMLAFAYSTKMETLYLPYNLLYINMQAFSGCESLKKIYYDTDSPAIIFTNTFDEETYKQALLYVPYEMKSVMESKSGWENFINIIETDLAGMVEISNDNIDAPEYFDLNGMRISTPSSGQIVIKRIGNKIEKIKL